MSYRDSYWVNRTICDVLEDMRKCYESRNFASLLGLIEEAQYMANRMESGLNDKADIKEINEEWHRKRKAIKELRKEYDDLKAEVDKLKENKPDE